jgi:hypothetical protein
MSNAYRRTGDPNEVISALATPKEGHSTSDIFAVLAAHQIADSSQLTPGVISLRAPRKVLEALESVARVEPKVMRSMHRPG